VVHGPSLPVSTVQHRFVRFLLRAWRSLISLRSLLILHPSPIISALTLWEHDNSLTIALDVCKAFFEPIEFLINYFPGTSACHISQPLLPSFYAWPAMLIYKSQPSKGGFKNFNSAFSPQKPQARMSQLWSNSHRDAMSRAVSSAFVLLTCCVDGCRVHSHVT
jgi:hypothetical protein